MTNLSFKLAKGNIVENFRGEYKVGPVSRNQVGLFKSEPLINATHPETAKHIVAHIGKDK